MLKINQTKYINPILNQRFINIKVLLMFQAKWLLENVITKSVSLQGFIIKNKIPPNPYGKKEHQILLLTEKDNLIYFKIPKKRTFRFYYLLVFFRNVEQELWERCDPRKVYQQITE